MLIRILEYILYYYNVFLEKGSYKDKWMFVYYKCYIMIGRNSGGIDVNKISTSKECDICH